MDLSTDNYYDHNDPPSPDAASATPDVDSDPLRPTADVKEDDEAGLVGGGGGTAAAAAGADDATTTTSSSIPPDVDVDVGVGDEDGGAYDGESRENDDGLPPEDDRDDGGEEKEASPSTTVEPGAPSLDDDVVGLGEEYRNYYDDNNGVEKETSKTMTSDEPAPSMDLVTTIANEVQRRRRMVAAAVVAARRRGGRRGGRGGEDPRVPLQPGTRGYYRPSWNQGGLGRGREGGRMGRWRKRTDEEGGGEGGVAFYDDELDGDLDGMMRDHPDFRELCEDMGIDPNTHPGLLRGRGDRSRLFRNNLHHRYRYKNVSPEAIVKSTWCGYCIAASCLVVVATMVSVAITEGFAHVNDGIKEDGTASTTKVDSQWWEHVDAGNDGGDVEGGGGGQDFLLTPEEVAQLSYALSDAYLPMWFDSTSGWTGTTYDEALNFCESHDNFVPCPYEV
jgi:hypothetical protein